MMDVDLQRDVNAGFEIIRFPLCCILTHVRNPIEQMKIIVTNKQTK
jgi:hypothetical protein